MLNKKRENPSNSSKKVKKKEKDKNNNITKINNNIDNNKLYTFGPNQNYTLDGFGKLKLIEGKFSIMGYSLSENETINFNFNEDYPLFKYINSFSSKFEIYQESKYHLYTDINSLIHVSYIPKALANLNYENYGKFFVCGNKCVGKNMLIPYMINRILSNKENKLYFLECDIIHPIIPFNFCISLINIQNPIISNVPILLNEDNYKIIKSIYIRNSFDIKNIINVIDLLINDYYTKISDNKSVLLINQFSSWDNNYDVLNNYIYQKYFKSDEKSCLIFIKNKYKIIESSSNENKDKNNNSILEEIIFKNKDDFYLFGNIFTKNDGKNKINKNCNKLEVDMNFRYGDDDSNCNLDINNKKKLEEKKSIQSHFDIKSCKKYSISIKDIIFLYDNPFIHEYKNEIKDDNGKETLKEIIIDSILNKYCIILKSNQDFIQEKNQFYFFDDIPNKQLEIISFTKIISFDKEKDILNLFCNSDLDGEIKKNKKIVIINEPKIEKVMKKNKKSNFNEILAKAEFFYDVTNEDETKLFSNGLNYLGNCEDEFL